MHTYELIIYYSSVYLLCCH